MDNDIDEAAGCCLAVALFLALPIVVGLASAGMFWWSGGNPFEGFLKGFLIVLVIEFFLIVA